MNTETPTTETLNPSRGRFNRAAIKRQFKLVSEVTRGGKFTRVSEEAINLAEADAEVEIRRFLYTAHPYAVGGAVKCPEGVSFLTGEGKERLVEAFNNFIAARIQRRVNDTRTGSTL